MIRSRGIIPSTILERQRWRYHDNPSKWIVLGIVEVVFASICAGNVRNHVGQTRRKIVDISADSIGGVGIEVLVVPGQQLESEIWPDKSLDIFAPFRF